MIAQATWQLNPPCPGLLAADWFLRLFKGLV
jgi:hypothetical protein